MDENDIFNQILKLSFSEKIIVISSGLLFFAMFYVLLVCLCILAQACGG